MGAQVEEGLKRMFAAFGRKPFKQQWDVYLEKANVYNDDVVLKAVEKIILYDDKLPSVAKLNREAKLLLSQNRKKSITGIDDCWFCQGTGYVPYLYSPNEKSQIWYTANMGCKCRAGRIKPIRKYFQDNQKLQFEKEADKYPDMAYPQIIDKMKMLNNSELKP